MQSHVSKQSQMATSKQSQMATSKQSQMATSESPPRTVFKLKKKVPVEAPKPIQAPRSVFKLKKKPTIPCPPNITKAVEAFQIIKEYYEAIEEPIPNSEIQWYIDELARETYENNAFWEECIVTKTFLDACGTKEDEVDVWKRATQKGKERPLKDSDIGTMPPYGTGEFWAWCRRRKQLRLQKEAAKKEKNLD